MCLVSWSSIRRGWTGITGEGIRTTRRTCAKDEMADLTRNVNDNLVKVYVFV